MDLKTELIEASKKLQGVSSSPTLDAEILLAFVLSCPRVSLVSNRDEKISKESKILFDALLKRRTLGEPIAYIVGQKEFFGRDFIITPDVLIPRPETELLVEEVCSLSPLPQRILEIGVGSGCVLCSILLTFQAEGFKASGVGVDISDEALAIALKNTEKHELSSSLVLQKGDLFAGITEKFDVVVSNPPYVSVHSPLMNIETSFEPEVALFSEADGLGIIRKLITQSPSVLNDNGALLFEFGFGQDEEIEQLFAENGRYTLEILPDLAGIPRIAKAILTPSL